MNDNHIYRVLAELARHCSSHPDIPFDRDERSVRKLENAGLVSDGKLTEAGLCALEKWKAYVRDHDLEPPSQDDF